MKHPITPFFLLLGWLTLASGTSLHAASGSAQTGNVTVDTRDAPTLANPSTATITAIGAILGGNVTSDGGAAITERGVVYSLTAINSTPAIGGTGVTKVTEAASTTGAFTVAITGLDSGTRYSFAAFATNAVGTSYTSVRGFDTAIDNLTATYTAGSDVPLSLPAVTLAGGTATLTLGYAPVPGTELTVVKNTGLNFINGTFSNLTQGQVVPLSYNGVTFNFIANYHGGTGNDLVLQWAGSTAQVWGAQTLDPRDFHHPFVKVASGSYHSVALKRDGTVVAWGGNWLGQTTVPAAAQSGVVAIAAGSYHTVALKSDGTVVAWGYNGSGQTTLPAEAQSGVAAIAAGSYHTVALKSDGTVIAWGDDGYGQTTVPAEAQSGVAAIAAGATHTVALKSDGTVITWGNNDNGQTTVPAAAQSGVAAVAAGDYHTIALKSDGTVVSWGANWFGQTTVPTEAQSGVAAIAAGEGHSVALKSGGTVVAWGNNNLGQTTVSGAAQSGVAAIAAGGFHTLALKSDGTLVAWGNNDNGQTTVPSALQSSVAAIAAGAAHTVVLKSDGTLAAWGSNAYGLTTVPAGAQSGVVAIAARENQMVVLKSDGMVVAWGGNDYGQTTVPAAAQSGVAAIAAGSLHTVALKSDGTVVAWGGNDYGQTTVPAAAQSGVAAIAAGSLHTVALESDGTVVTWGYNGFGQTTVPANLSGVTAVAAGDYRTIALKGDGTVIAWGDNGFGQTTVPTNLSRVRAVAAGRDHTVVLVPQGPSITNLLAGSLSPAGAALTSTVTPNGQVTSVSFEYGTTTSYGTTLPVTLADPSALTPQAAVATLSGLQPGTTYHYRMTASSVVGTTTSVNGTFTTQGLAPSLAAPSSTAITLTGATLGGDVTSDGGVSITERGVVYSLTATNSDPAIGGTGVTKVTTTGTTGVFTVPVTGLSPGTGYSFKAYSTNSAGTSYTDVATFSTASEVVATYASAGHIPLTSNGLVATGLTAQLSLNFAPVPGSSLTVVKNTGLSFIQGQFSNLAHGQTVPLTYNGTTYNFVANYYGGTGNDLVLQWAGVTPHVWGNHKLDPRDFQQPFVQIAAGKRHTIGLRSDGKVVAWGSNFSGTATVPAGLSGITAIAGGYSHTVGLKDDGTVVAWGNNGFGQTTIPAALNNVVAIAAGSYHTVAVKTDGTVVAWGHNDSGQTTVPAGLSGVAAIAAGVSHTVALKSDGTIVAWGLDSEGQSTVPSGLSGVTAIAAGAYHTMALKSDGTVVAWGRGNEGQTTVPSGLSDVAAVAAGDYHSVALKTDGTVAAWGRNVFGETTVPAGLSGVVAISAGEDHTVALKIDGTVVAWGDNWYGQATVPTRLSGLIAISASSGHTAALKRDGEFVAWGDYYFGATRLPEGLSGLVSIAAGALHTVGLKNDGTVAAWGFGSEGQTVVPSGLSGVASIAAGSAHSLAVKSDGTVVAWGLNDSDQTTVPVGLSDIAAIAAGDAHTVGLKSNGMVVAWGNNSDAQTTIPAGLSGVTAIAAGHSHTVALLIDGTVVAWGNNNSGQTTVPLGLSGVTAIGAGDYHTVALRNDGTAILWGDDSYGQATVPTGLSGLAFITAGGGRTVALVAQAPSITHIFPSALSLNGGTLSTSVTPNGQVTSVQFEYGTTTTYGTTVPVTLADPSSLTPQVAAATLSGLQPGTTYHYRLNATNVVGTTTSVDGTFTTQGLAPSLAAPTSTAITLTGATLGGEVTSDGGAPVTERGVVYSVTATNSSPVIGGPGVTKVTTTGTTGSITVPVTGLSPGTGYSFKAYATNSAGTSYTDVATFSTASEVVATYDSAAHIPLTADGFVATGITVQLALNFAPSPGQVLTLVNNTSGAAISGTFAGLPQGATVSASYGGNVFAFTINYAGGDGNDITLTRTAGAGQVATGVYSWTNFAGMPGESGSADGTGNAARFYGPSGVAVDRSGNVYVADTDNFTIRKITNAGAVSTLAGSARNPGSVDGTGTVARFSGLFGVAVDGSGTAYVADNGNHTIRQITGSGVVSTLAGNAGNSGSTDGTGSTARFSQPFGVAVDGSGNIYVADSGNHSIRKITNAGVVTNLAGGAGNLGSVDGAGSFARFSSPRGVAVDGNGNVFAADTFNHTIRMITTAGVVSTLAGLAGYEGSSDGTTSAARFFNPYAVAVDGSGTVYVADRRNHTIRKITSAGVVTTIGGTAGVSGGADGLGASAQFSSPSGIAVASTGELFVADVNNNRISRGTPDDSFKPLLTQGAASAIGSTGATLNGTVNPNGFVTTAEFEFGNTPSYGNTASVTLSPNNGTIAQNVSAVLTGLTPGTTYCFRLRATNVDGTRNTSGGTFTTDKLAQTITFANLGTQAFGVPVTLSATGGGSGNPVIFTIVSGPATVSGSTLTTTGVGDVTVRASQAGNGSYNAAPDVEQTFTVTQPVPTFSFASATPSANPVNSSGQPNLVQVVINRGGGSFGAVSVQVVPSLSATVAWFARYVYGTDYEFVNGSVAGATVSFASGQTSATVDVQLKAPATTKKGQFKLTLASPTGGATLAAPTSATVTINAKDTVKPILALTSPAPRTATVSASFDVVGTVKDNNGLSAFSVKLNGVTVPLTVNPLTSFVVNTAVPFTASGAVPENGTNTLVIEATDASGNKTILTKVVTYTNSRPELAGSYDALLIPVGAPDIDTTGLVTVTVANSGTFTGRATLSGVSVAFTGLLNNAGNAKFNPGAGEAVSLIDTVEHSYLGALALTVNSATGLTGSLSTRKTGGSVLATFSGKRAPYSKTVSAPAEALGTFNVAFLSKDQNPMVSLSAYPQGDGYARMTVSTIGSVSLSGRLADGAIYTAAGRLREDGTVALFTQLYRRLGALSGEVSLDAASVTDVTVTGSGLIWLRPALPRSLYYPQGWPAGVRVDSIGAKFISPGSLDFGQGAADLVNGNATLIFTDGALTGDIAKPVSVNPGPASAGQVKLIPATNATYRFVLPIVNGLFTGSFTHTDGTTTAYSGILIGKGPYQGGYGYFLSTPPADTWGGTGEGGRVFLNPAP